MYLIYITSGVSTLSKSSKLYLNNFNSSNIQMNLIAKVMKMKKEKFSLLLKMKLMMIDIYRVIKIKLIYFIIMSKPSRFTSKSKATKP